MCILFDLDGVFYQGNQAIEGGIFNMGVLVILLVTHKTTHRQYKK